MCSANTNIEEEIAGTWLCGIGNVTKSIGKAFASLFVTKIKRKTVNIIRTPPPPPEIGRREFFRHQSPPTVDRFYFYDTTSDEGEEDQDWTYMCFKSPTKSERFARLRNLSPTRYLAKTVALTWRPEEFEIAPAPDYEPRRLVLDLTEEVYRDKPDHLNDNIIAGQLFSNLPY